MRAVLMIAALLSALLAGCGGGDYTEDEPMGNDKPSREAAR